MAVSKGYETVFDGRGKRLLQGPDQVYKASDGRLIVYEAKGGSSQLGHAYGYPQGSSEWAVESAKRVLRSPKAGLEERAAAREILEAAARGKLAIHVVRTNHVLGEPTTTVLEQSSEITRNASRLARSALTGDAKSAADVGLAADTELAAGTAFGTGMRLGTIVGRGLFVVNVAATGALTYRDIQRFNSGEIGAADLAIKVPLHGTNLGLAYIIAFTDPEPVSKTLAVIALFVVVAVDAAHDKIIDSQGANSPTIVGQHRS